MERPNVEIEWSGETHECVPGPAFLVRVEQRPRGLAMREAMESLRVSDMAWITYCALKPHVRTLKYEDVIEAHLENPAYYEQAAMDMCIETLAPEAARKMRGAPGKKPGKKSKSEKPEKPEKADG